MEGVEQEGEGIEGERMGYGGSCIEGAGSESETSTCMEESESEELSGVREARSVCEETTSRSERDSMSVRSLWDESLGEDGDGEGRG